MIRDMTKGSPLKSIILMSVPVMVGNLFQQFYGMTDAVIVGRCLGTNALAAVGSTSSLYYLVLWFATGAGNGFAIIVSQLFGAGKYEKMRDRVCMSVVLSAFVAAVLTVFSLVFIRRFLVLMNTPGEILEDAYRYIAVILAGLTATMLYNLAAAILRALGDSRTPLYFLVITSLLNIVLDILFIRGLHMGTEGAALATVISQAVSVALCVVYMRKKFPVLHIKKQNWRFQRQEAVQMLNLGLPMGAQGAITASGVIVLQFAINSYGAQVMAAFAAATKVEQLFSQPLAAYSVTMANYVGQNYGAGKTENIRGGVRQCLLLVLGTAVVSGALLIMCGGFLSGLFLSEKDMQVILYAKEYLHAIGLSVWAFGLLCMFRSSIQGMGDARIPMINGMVESVSRILWTIWLIHKGNFHQLCLANPATWILAAVMLTVLYRRKIKKL